MTKQKLAQAFEEWKRRFDENPDEFLDCEAFKAEPPETYGEAAAIYFIWLTDTLFPDGAQA